MLKSHGPTENFALLLLVENLINPALKGGAAGRFITIIKHVMTESDINKIGAGTSQKILAVGTGIIVFLNEVQVTCDADIDITSWKQIPKTFGVKLVKAVFLVGR